MSAPKVPNHVKQLYGFKRARQFKSLKRQELRKIFKALDEFRVGSYYIPEEAYEEMLKIEKSIEQIKQNLSVKKWGN